jgi:diaminopimelate epimerase
LLEQFIISTVTLPFFKYSANGNDFILLDNPSGLLLPQTIERMCDRHFGIGADGVLVLNKSAVADARMQIFNADGGEAEMCGNGLRCLVTYFDSIQQQPKDIYTIQTMNHIYQTYRVDKTFALGMNEISDQQLMNLPELKAYARNFFVNTGVPHLVLLTPKVDEIDVKRQGAEYRYHPAFAKGANINFLEVLDQARPEVRVRTYERGVEDETFSCGTGLTACALALQQWFGWSGSIVLRTKGGRHVMELGEQLLFSGEVTFCFKGEFYP